MYMLINSVSEKLFSAPELATIQKLLDAGRDASLSVGQSARTLIVAALFAHNPRPMLYVVSGEEAADRAGRALAAWLGMDAVCHYPMRRERPWQETPIDDAAVGARTKAIARLAAAEPCVCVASARSLLRRVPPLGTGYYAGSSFAVGDELPFDELPLLLVGMGYSDTGEVKEPGSFHVHGDSVDVFPAQATSPVRLEFFGDEIDHIKKMVPATGQTIGELLEVEISPCREYALSDEAIQRAEKALYDAAQESSDVAAELELIRQRAASSVLEKYLPVLYGSSASPIEHISDTTLVVLGEPRALFDDCQRAYDEIVAAAGSAQASIEGLYTAPRDLDFGAGQRLSFASMLTAGVANDVELTLRQPSIAGADSKLLGTLRRLAAEKYSVVFAVPERAARENLKLHLSDEGIAFTDDREGSLTPGLVSFTDKPIPAGVILPSACFAVLSVSDLETRSAKSRRARRVDPTTVTFAFKPGDYVVHATHGIAFFSEIVRQEVGGKERDYFLLEYAQNDKLYVPLEQVDRITRYVGPDGAAPRLTRLNTADWSRAVGKARASAKKLAFDLVDLYTRRASVEGFAFSADTPAQEDMEANFDYELTSDQKQALADIKTDMEAPKPMDRLLCGDVGFGKTEVALRAAFKCAQDGKQAMVLCPTTILAQQHYETFFSRFTPFGVRVAVLSRFITPTRQRKTLEAFAKGEVDVLVGTHRLLSNDVNPKNLGLVIIDEEQRFGVGHKEQLKNMREQVDVLTLSATPIPRTMQMAISGVRDMSLILTPPAGRLPVKVFVGEYNPDLVQAAIRAELNRKGQVYYVSNRVASIDDAVARVLEVAPEARVALAHGQMSASEAEDVMLRFQEHEVDVLVATTIIENGIDNPLTNTLIIEDSQRLGLAQLYQLKGRVGRGKEQAFAYFMFAAEAPLTPEAVDRLTAIHEYQELGSGMRIAMRDLEIRGAGSIMGAEQHGNLSGVGFDLFTSMLGEAVAEARGETPDPEAAEVGINLPAEVFLSEEYCPDIDRRVLLYRRVAAAIELTDIDAIEKDCDESFGPLPLAARNLLDRARIRIRAQRLGISSVSLSGGKLHIQDVDVPKDAAFALKSKGAIIFPKTRKLSFPLKVSEEQVMPAALLVLEAIGGDDEPQE